MPGIRKINPAGTLPLFTPASNWKAPNLSDLPSWRASKLVALDTEFKDTALVELGIGARRGAKMAGFSFMLEGDRPYYVPLRHPHGGNVDCEKGLAYLRDNLGSFEGELLGANMNVDLDILHYENVRPDYSKCITRDVQVIEALINELHHKYSLEAIGERRGIKGKDKTLLEEAAACYGANTSKRGWEAIIADLPAQFVGPYAEHDVLALFPVWQSQLADIARHDLQQVVDLESRLLPVLLRMRQRGVRIDFDHLERVEAWAYAEEGKALAEVKRLTGVEIPVGSTMAAAVVAPALIAAGFEPPLDTRGKFSVTAEFLTTCPHPVGKLIRQARQMDKIRTTFVASIRRYQTNGRIHCVSRQTVGVSEKNEKSGAAFGRISTVHPNLAQQPSRASYANFWRQIYIPEEGCQWGSLDYCFSPDTEILTRDRGFVPFPKLSETDCVAQVDVDTGALTYCKPLARQILDYSGDLIHIYGMRSTDMLVTPNHDCLVYHEKRGAEIVKAEDYPLKWAYRQKVSGELQTSTLTFTEREIVTSVAVQADGTLRTGHYRIWVSRPNKVQRCIELVAHTNSYGCEVKGNQTAFTVPLDATPLLEKGPEKRFSRPSLLAMSLEQRRFFLHELLKWDGTGTLNGHGKALYSTTNEHNAQVVQEVAAVSGIKAKLTSKKPPNRKMLYMVHLSVKTHVTTETITKTRVPYAGKVYCVTTPNGTVVVRRNGQVAVTAQCAQEPRWVTHFASKLNLTGGKEAARRYKEDLQLDCHQDMADLTGLKRTDAKAVLLAQIYGEGGAKLCNHQLHLPTRWCVQLENKERHYFDSMREATQFRCSHKGKARMWEVAGEQGQHVIDTFNEKAPYIQELSRLAINKAERTGVLNILGGRKLHFPLLKDGRYDWGYKALNRIIQGTSAYQMKLAMLEMDRSVPDFFLQMQVYDEVDGSAASVTTFKQVAEIMATVAPAEVPFRIDAEIGSSWGQLELICNNKHCTRKAVEKDGKKPFYCEEH